MVCDDEVEIWKGSWPTLPGQSQPLASDSENRTWDTKQECKPLNRNVQFLFLSLCNDAFTVVGANLCVFPTSVDCE
jgi:hypothetical protein